MEKDIAGNLADRDEYETYMVKDMAQALKETLRRDAQLRNNNTVNTATETSL